jgi:hypothetical protein
MPGLDDVNPDEVSFPEEDEPADVPVADPDAEASADEDLVATDDDAPLSDTDPHKTW